MNVNSLYTTASDKNLTVLFEVTQFVVEQRLFTTFCRLMGPNYGPKISNV